MRDGWTETTLGEAAEVVMGQSPPGSTYNTEGDGLPFLQGSAEFGAHHPKPEKWCSAPKKVAKRGDLLVSVRAPVGDRNYADQQYAIGRGLSIIRGTEVATAEYLGLAVEHGISELEARSGGGMFASITKKGLLGLPVLLPPLVEQERIVDLISALDATLAATEAVISEMQNLLRTVAFRHITADDTWERRSVAEVSAFAGGYAFPDRFQGAESGDYPFYKVSDMNAPGNETFMLSAQNYVTTEVLRELKAKAWPEGTVIFPKVGAALLTEKRRLLSVPAAFDNNVMGLVADTTQVLPGYLYAFMETVSLGKLAQHGAVPSINQSHIRSLEIPVPPLKVQREVVSLITSLRDSTQEGRRTASALAALRASLVRALLSGEDVIPESYDELLAKES